MRIFADGAELSEMRRLAEDDRIEGFTTNPTLMRKAGLTDYRDFAARALDAAAGKPISFEVFADTLSEMKNQALRVSAWDESVYVKIPVTNTKGRTTRALVHELGSEGVRVNVTAVFTHKQAFGMINALENGPPAFVSIFAGRIADAGHDPCPLIQHAAEEANLASSRIEIIWASPREILNVKQAEAVGCHVITLTPDLIAKLALFGKDLEAFSRETVQMFRTDAIACGLEL